MEYKTKTTETREKFAKVPYTGRDCDCYEDEHEKDCKPDRLWFLDVLEKHQLTVMLILVIVAGVGYLGISLGNQYLLRLINQHRQDAANIATVSLINQLYNKASTTGEIQLRNVILQDGKILIDENGKIVQGDIIKLVVEDNEE